MGSGRLRRTTLGIGLALLLAGCSATTTAITKRNLDVQTKMTETIFLDPVPAAQRTVFVQVRNTSDKPDFDIEPAVRAAVESRGYRVVDDPTEAYYLLQANVLQAGRNSESGAESSFAGGFGSMILGGAAGAGAGRVASENPSVIIGGALAGAAIAAVADAFVQDVTYSIISDVQVSERAAPGGGRDRERAPGPEPGHVWQPRPELDRDQRLEALPHPGDEQGREGQSRVRGGGPRPGRRPDPGDLGDLLRLRLHGDSSAALSQEPQSAIRAAATRRSSVSSTL